MTNHTPNHDRLDRVETILTAIAEQQQRTQVQIDRNVQGLAELRSEILSLGERQEAADQRLRESIESTNQRLQTSIESTNQQLQASIGDVVSIMGDLAEQQNETDQRFQVLLEEARADRSRMDQHITQARQDGLKNNRDHRAFTQTMQSMLAEIARIWQRLAG